MYSNLTKHRKNIAVLVLLVAVVMVSLPGRLGFFVLFRSEHYNAMAEDLHQRERTIKAARGRIIGTNRVVIADSKTMCTISVIYNRVKDREQAIRVLCDELDLDEELVRKQVEKRSSREIIKTNVDKELRNQIRSYRLMGIKMDENYKRCHPYDSLASKVLGFARGDNQGIIGLEVKCEKYLEGMNGKILTMSDAKSVEVENAAEDKVKSIPGSDLHIDLDVGIQEYAEQLAYQVLEKKNTKKISIIVMNPQNGEPIAMVNVPEFNLNDPFILNQNSRNQSFQELATRSQRAMGASEQELLNQMWRSTRINDTYEPGSTFKIIMTAADLESGVTKPIDQFSCPGFRMVEDRKTKCHKAGGHGAGTFLQGVTSSCNPAFIDMRQRLGVDGCYEYFTQFGLEGRTGIDLSGEVATTMHKKENMGLMKLATASFGRSFQITPIQFIAMAASIVDGGSRVIPHFGVETVSVDSTPVHKLDYSSGRRILSEETSATIRYVLEQVVPEGGGKKAKLEGHRIGGKTVTLEKLSRSLKKYISSSVDFAPIDNPQVMAFVTIDEPEGIHYGGTIATPVVGNLFKNILPYLGIEAVQEETAVHLSNPQLIISGKRHILIIK